MEPPNTASALGEELSSALKKLHRALIMVEAGNDETVRDPYTLLFAVINDPRFAWLNGLSQLIVRLDEMLMAGELSTVSDLLPFRVEAARLLGEESENAEFRLRHLIALQNAPDVALATGSLRRVLAKFPSPEAE